MPDTSPPQTPRDRLLALTDDRQAKLLDPAENEFASHGFAEASLNRILKQADMSKGQAYYYVTDKTDLYDAVLNRAFQKLIKASNFSFGSPENPDAFWAQVGALFGQVGMVLMQDAQLAALAIRIYENDATRAVAQRLPIRKSFEDCIAQGQSIGAIRTDIPNDLLIDILFAMALETDRWFAANWTRLQPPEFLAFNARIIAMFRSVASPPPQ